MKEVRLLCLEILIGSSASTFTAISPSIIIDDFILDVTVISNIGVTIGGIREIEAIGVMSMTSI